jgi:hypothetical protein
MGFSLFLCRSRTPENATANEGDGGLVYALLLFAASLALGYQLRFREATRHLGRLLSYELRSTEATRKIGRALSGTDSLEIAITPPGSSYAAFAVYAVAFLIMAFGFYRYGFLRGIAAFLGFFVLVTLNRLLLLPKPESLHFRDFVLRSMVRRYANYLRAADKVRATAMAELLKCAGIPADELASGRH